jgi:hypothetical protein
MSSIRAVHQTFTSLIAEAKAARRDKMAQVESATRLQSEGTAQATRELLDALAEHASPEHWHPSPLATEALVYVANNTVLRQRVKADLEAVTPVDVAADRLALSKLESSRQSKQWQVTEAQNAFTQAQAQLPEAFQLRWGEAMRSPTHNDLLALMTPPPSAWNVMARLRASEAQRQMWRVVGTYDRQHGAGSLVRQVNQVWALDQDRFEKETESRALKQEAQTLRQHLDSFDAAQAHWESLGSVDQQNRAALGQWLEGQPEDKRLAWLTDQAPERVKAYTFAQAKKAGASRVLQGLQAQVKAVDKIISKLEQPMTKLNKGLRQAPSKYISVDDTKIAHQVREALATMKPMDASAAAALDAVNRLQVEPDSVSQAKFYQRAQSVSPTDGCNWILMWMLLEGQFNPAVALLAGADPALALGMAAVLPAWNQDNWDSLNAAPAPSVDPNLGLPASATSVPDPATMDGIVPQGNFDTPAVFDPNVTLPSMDVPMPLDLPSLDTNLPNLDVGMPALDIGVPDIHVDLPVIDVSVPDVTFSMPDITIDTSSLSSGGGDFNF